ncbi:MAG TPA: hypothetical protein VKQ72_01005, partial [Aggregatilineales bacterium]|nr:hypothetical protein [Aggregatilineales bacterium]
MSVKNGDQWTVDGMGNITTIVQREVADYALESPNATAYYVERPQQNLYAVISVPTRNPQKATVM